MWQGGWQDDAVLLDAGAPSLLDGAPTANLYVPMPEGETLQMCYMRPEPEEACGELPFLVPAPAPGASPASVMRGGAMALPRRGGGEPSDDDDCSAALQTVRLVEAALASDEPLPRLALSADDWADAFSATPPPFATNTCDQLMRLIAMVRSQELCDRLLECRLPPLCDDGGAREGQPDEEPLPRALAELLRRLLRQGSALRAGPDEFDARVLRPLRQAPGRWGAAAAAEAARVYAASGSGVRGGLAAKRPARPPAPDPE